MTKWTITQGGSKVYEYEGEECTYNFPAVTDGFDKEYEVSVIDNNGCATSTTYVVKSKAILMSNIDCDFNYVVSEGKMTNIYLYLVLLKQKQEDMKYYSLDVNPFTTNVFECSNIDIEVGIIIPHSGRVPLPGLKKMLSDNYDNDASIAVVQEYDINKEEGREIVKKDEDGTYEFYTEVKIDGTIDTDCYSEYDTTSTVYNFNFKFSLQSNIYFMSSNAVGFEGLKWFLTDDYSKLNTNSYMDFYTNDRFEKTFRKNIGTSDEEKNVLGEITSGPLQLHKNHDLGENMYLDLVFRDNYGFDSSNRIYMDIEKNNHLYVLVSVYSNTANGIYFVYTCYDVINRKTISKGEIKYR